MDASDQAAKARRDALQEKIDDGGWSGGADPERIRQLIVPQKTVMVAILIQIALQVLALTGAIAASNELLVVVNLGLIGAFVFLMVGAVMWYLRLWGWPGIFAVIGSIIPLVNLLIMLIANRKTNEMAKAAGFEVGFLGVKPNRDLF